MIDLIFGHKQQGPAAVEAVNLYHPLFYERNVDIYSIEDTLKKNAVIGFINNFGQTPKQLFKKSHPVKKVAGALGSGSGGSSVMRIRYWTDASGCWTSGHSSDDHSPARRRRVGSHHFTVGSIGWIADDTSVDGSGE